ncbi:MAG TPA: DNA mismatch repair endonuclease MutL [Gemmatimonadales bacterium]|nr:DNA mismatch repair endonuclease MutL [Gemmatimonadales bacterium]
MAARRIAILPDVVANRIAAGEVVERPASVVKELLENALDAKASAVAISIESGGKTLVRVADDGEGMGREDALLALDRHATSKLRAADELVGIATFGFRGEALPSIASVSRFELETAVAGDPVGTRLVATGGLVSTVEDAVRQPGTTVTVRSLFFNTPARRKFLRSARSETRASVDAVTTLALALPRLGVALLADGKQVVEALPAPTLAERAAQVLGRRFAATLLPVAHEAGVARITGLVQRPAEASPTGRVAHLFVNGRPIRDHFLVRAAERGYRATVPSGSRPSVILMLELPAADVDVNVHPAKLEVRFRDRYALEAAVEEAVHRALGDVVSAAPLGAAKMPWEHLAVSTGARTGAAPSAELTSDETEGLGLLDSDGLDVAAEGEVAAAGREAWSQPSLEVDAGRQVRVLAQVHESFILVESPDALLIVDQHSAHERILYERTMRALESGAESAQKLLFPLTLEFTPAELDAIEANAEPLAKLGWELEPFGGRSIAVHAVPAPHARFDAERCLKDVVADLAGGRFGGLANPLERFASTFACRAAIKAGQALTAQEMEELVDRLFSTELPAHDVHGRPTIVQLPLGELERRFGRR